MSTSVLIVDDSQFLRTTLVNMLKETLKVDEIFEAINGIDAVKLYRMKKPNLVTMDIDMPEMNGLDATKRIKLFDPNAKILMVTSSNKKNEREEAEKIGILGYITKPFDHEKIKKEIGKLL
jgi:two-component system chemotaxis response regulator CheY